MWKSHSEQLRILTNLISPCPNCMRAATSLSHLNFTGCCGIGLGEVCVRPEFTVQDRGRENSSSCVNNLPAKPLTGDLNEAMIW